MTHVMLVVWEISRTNASQDAILSNGPSGAPNFPKVTFLLIYPSQQNLINTLSLGFKVVEGAELKSSQDTAA